MRIGIAKIVGLLLLILGFVAGLLYATGFDLAIVRPPEVDITYADFITLLLTAIAVLLAIVATIVGVLGVIGWRNFGTKLKENSQRILDQAMEEEGVLRSALQEALEPGGVLYESIRRDVLGIMYNEVRTSLSDVDTQEDGPPEEGNK